MYLALPIYAYFIDHIADVRSYIPLLIHTSNRQISPDQGFNEHQPRPTFLEDQILQGWTSLQRIGFWKI